MSKKMISTIFVVLGVLGVCVLTYATTVYTDVLAPGNSETYGYYAYATPIPTTAVINTTNVTGNINYIETDITIRDENGIIGFHDLNRTLGESVRNLGPVDYSISSTQNNTITHHITIGFGNGGTAFFKTTISD